MCAWVAHISVSRSTKQLGEGTLAGREGVVSTVYPNLVVAVAEISGQTGTLRLFGIYAAVTQGVSPSIVHRKHAESFNGSVCDSLPDRAHPRAMLAQEVAASVYVLYLLIFESIVKTSGAERELLNAHAKELARRNANECKELFPLRVSFGQTVLMRITVCTGIYSTEILVLAMDIALTNWQRGTTSHESSGYSS